MEKYFRMEELNHTPKTCVLWGISVTKEGEGLRRTGGLSYTRLRELLLKKMTQLGYNPKAYGVHSLCADVAMAAENAGVPDKLFKWQSHWKMNQPKMVT